MQITWTKLPFVARNQHEFSQGLTDWLGRVFYDILPEQGYEVREEQIYTAFRMARTLTDGATLFAEAGPGTGKTFAYLLPAICHARYKGKPVLVASATGVLQAQLMDPEGDIRTLSRLLQLNIDARVAADPGEYICEAKVDRVYPERPLKGWKKLHDWARRTGTGARKEIPDVSDELWAHVNWDPSLACDTCTHRGHCHVMAARRHYRAAVDLVVCDHKLFTRDLLTRAERQEAGGAALLPSYSAVVLDEGHHMPETWQRAQGHVLSARRLLGTLEWVEGFANRPGMARAEVVDRARARAELAGRRFLEAVQSTAEPGEGKRGIDQTRVSLEAARLTEALEAIQDVLVPEEAMNEGTETEVTLGAYQGRLDEILAVLGMLRSDQAVTWVEGQDLWVVPRRPANLFAAGRLPQGMPVIFSSATLEPAYMARVLQLGDYDASRVGVPFDLAEQALVYMPQEPKKEIAHVTELIRVMKGRTLVLLNSAAEVARYRQALRSSKLPWPLLFEGDADRGAMLDKFRSDEGSVLFGSTFWEGVDVPGKALSCCIIPRLPFPAHDPLIRERRSQAEVLGEDPFVAVDLPEMLLKLKQGAGRLIRTREDRGVLALLDLSFQDKPWADAVSEALPEDAERTDDLGRVGEFC